MGQYYENNKCEHHNAPYWEVKMSTCKLCQAGIGRVGHRKQKSRLLRMLNYIR